MKKIQVFSFLMVLGILFYSFIQPDNQQPDEILFPKGYRNWVHIKTAINNPTFASHSGFHHIYGNEIAIKGYETGNFPDGSIIVFDVLESAKQANEDVFEGKRKLIDMMVKDHKKYSESGGWGFQEFVFTDSTERKVLIPTKQQCFGCHNSKKDKDYVFSKLRD